MFYNTDRLIHVMKEYNLDAIIASTKENIRYFTGFEPVIKTLNPYLGQCYVVITQDHPHQVNIVHSIGEIDQVLDAKVDIGQVRTYGTFYREYAPRSALYNEELALKNLSQTEHSAKTGEKALSLLLKDLGLAQSYIGIDENGFHPKYLSYIQNQFRQMQMIPFANEIRRVRAVKTSQEVKALTHAANCVENAIEDVINNIREGINEIEVATLFSTSIARQGALATLPMIKLGRHAVGGQRKQQSNIKLQPGDLIWFDCDIVCNGYWADIARVFPYKYLKPDYKKYDALYKGQITALNEVKPGMTGEDVFHLTMNAVHDAGFPEYRRHHVGHGIGLEPYELPILAPGSKDLVEEGMVLSIETPYYEFGLGALHVEDPVLVSRTKNTILTKTNGEIRVLG